MRYRLEQVRSESATREFHRHAIHQLGVEFPADYLRRSRLFVLRERGGAVRGGFLLCTEGPYRAIQGIPLAQRAAIQQQLIDRRCLEGSAMWLDQTVTSVSARALYWLGLIAQALRTGCRYWIITYSQRVPVLDEIHGSGAETLYEGEVFLEGMSEPDHEKVVLVHVRHKLSHLALHPRLLWRRIRKRTV